ncbi:phage head-tail connector protein [Brevibacillus sp. M2.1A]|uniref:phage head-tail connector protein n=1 Tax=Brevibacillus sp. M2.1A TaxID=2738980 RepID=UPI00156B3BD7|nr:phage head-tail connector protein [Brevibacillus sp. M2.1A]MCC8435475.1 phage head-tail connector protein [Brevibacillus sp. M2.1A]
MTWDEQIAKVLENVKLRLGLADGTRDALITSYITEIGLRIKHYCNISSIPDDLVYVWTSMAIDAVRVDLPNVDEIADSVGGGSNVKVGDTSTASGGSGGELSNTAKSVIDSVVFNYKMDLHRYRRLRW